MSMIPISMQVRRAEITDMQWILSELKDFSEFFGGKTPLWGDDAHVEKLVGDLIERHIMLVSDTGAERTGLIGGVLSEHLFNPKIKVLTELFWWTPVKWRNSKAGSMLLDEFTAYGKKHANWVVMTLETESPVPDSCLIKRGYAPKERSFYVEY